MKLLLPDDAVCYVGELFPDCAVCCTAATRGDLCDGCNRALAILVRAMKDAAKNGVKSRAARGKG